MTAVRNESSLGMALFPGAQISRAEATGSSDGLYRLNMQVFALRDSANWVSDAERSVDRLASLKDNWDSYGAKCVDERSIEHAKYVLEALGRITGIDRPQVAASPNGYVGFSWEWFDDTRSLDVEVLPSGHLRFCFVDHRTESEPIEVTTGELNQIVLLLTQW